MAISETICNFPVHESHLQHGFLIVILQFRIPDPFFARHLPSPCSLSVPIFFFSRDSLIFFILMCLLIIKDIHHINMLK